MVAFFKAATLLAIHFRLDKQFSFILGLFVLLNLQPSLAAILLRAEQVGADVVVFGSGSAVTAGLSKDGDNGVWTNVITDAQIYAGPDVFSNGNVSLFSGLLGPLSFGNDAALVELPATSGSNGDFFGILADNGFGVTQLVLPLAYSSGTVLNGTTTFAGRTLGELGLTPGQVTSWSWGSGPNADSLRLEIAPAPLPIAGAWVGMRMARRLRRRLKTSQK